MHLAEKCNHFSVKIKVFKQKASRINMAHINSRMKSMRDLIEANVGDDPLFWLTLPKEQRIGRDKRCTPHTEAPMLDYGPKSVFGSVVLPSEQTIDYRHKKQ
jgi:hypothetical protein